LTLSDPLSGVLVANEATGPISNCDALPRALPARFGRTVAVEVDNQVKSA